MRTLPLHDLRELEASQLTPHLEELWNEHPRGFWSVARRPGRRWTSSIAWARALVLSSAPLFELILWIEPEATPQLPESELEEQSFLLGYYSELFQTLSPAAEKVYAQRLHHHFERQEAALYPQMETLPFVDRAVRELRYEHQGLKKGLEGLGQTLEEARSRGLAKASKERLDLDFFHLLEHHLEREKEAIYPAWVFLNQRVDKSGNALL